MATADQTRAAGTRRGAPKPGIADQTQLDRGGFDQRVAAGRQRLETAEANLKAVEQGTVNRYSPQRWNGREPRWPTLKPA